jgi:hypothetical protein
MKTVWLPWKFHCRRRSCTTLRPSTVRERERIRTDRACMGIRPRPRGDKDGSRLGDFFTSRVVGSKFGMIICIGYTYQPIQKIDHRCPNKPFF